MTDIKLLKNCEEIRVNCLCNHVNIYNDSGTNICIDCGEEIEFLKDQREWKTHDPSDCKNIITCPVSDKNIYKDVQNMGYNTEIINMANTFFKTVIGNTICRGNPRLGIIASCIYYSCQSFGQTIDYTTLCKQFGIEQKIGLKCLKKVRLKIKKSNISTYNTILNIINEILNRFEIQYSNVSQITQLCEYVYNKSTVINSSKPHSIACAIIYHWIKSNKKNITLYEYSKIVNLSEITIDKLYREIDSIIRR